MSYASSKIPGLQGLDIFFIKLMFLAVLIIAFVLFIFLLDARGLKGIYTNSFNSYGTFFYANFLKPFGSSSERGQKHALESFYKTQVWLPGTQARLWPKRVGGTKVE